MPAGRTAWWITIHAIGELHELIDLVVHFTDVGIGGTKAGILVSTKFPHVPVPWWSKECCRAIWAQAGATNLPPTENWIAFLHSQALP